MLGRTWQVSEDRLTMRSRRRRPIVLTASSTSSESSAGPCLTTQTLMEKVFKAALTVKATLLRTRLKIRRHFSRSASVTCPSAHSLKSVGFFSPFRFSKRIGLSQIQVRSSGIVPLREIQSGNIGVNSN